MATVVGRSADSLEDEFGSFDNVVVGVSVDENGVLRYTSRDGQVTIIGTVPTGPGFDELKNKLDELNNVTLPQLEADLGELNNDLGELNNVTLPSIQTGLVEASNSALAAQTAADDAAEAAVLAQNKADAAAAAADGAIRTYGPEEYPTNPPWPNNSSQPANVLGDLWMNADGVAHRWNGTIWYVIPDSAAAAAMAAAQASQALAEAAQEAADDAQADANSLAGRVTTAESSLSSVTTRVATSEGEISTVKGRVTTAEGTLSSQSTRLTTAEGTLTTVNGRLNSAESNISTQNSRLTTAESDINSVETSVSNVNGSVSALTNRVTTAEGTVTDHTSRISTAESTISNHTTRLGTAEGNITSVTSIVNGKTKTTYSSNPPGSTANTAGDSWFQMSGSEVIAYWRGTGGTSWSTAKLGGAVLDHLDAGSITVGSLAGDRIAANAITTDKLAASAVTAAKIEAGSIDTTKIVTVGLDAAAIKFGTMHGDRIQSNTLDAVAIKAGTLSIGAVSNLQTSLDAKATASSVTALNSQVLTSTAFSTNPYLETPSGVVPTGFSSAGGSAITKTTTPGEFRTGTSAVKFTIAAGGAASYLTGGAGLLPFVAGEYVTVSADIKVVSGSDLSGSGLMVRWNDSANRDVNIPFSTEIPNPVIGQWYRIQKVIKRPASFVGPLNTFQVFVMGNYAPLGTATAKTLIYDRVDAWPSTVEEISAYNAETPAGAKTKADAAQLAAIEARASSANSTLSAWTGGNPNYPVGWGTWSAQIPTKNTTDAVTGGAAIEWNVDGSTQAGVNESTAFDPLPIGLQYVTVEIDFLLKSGTLNGAGLLLDWNGMTGGNRGVAALKDMVLSPVLNKWYKVSKVIKRPATATGTQTGWGGYLMGNFGAELGTLAAKNLVVDRLALRPSTVEEITAFEAPADAAEKANTARLAAKEDVKTMWGHPSNTTFIDGGDIYTNSIYATSIALSDWNNYWPDRYFNIFAGGGWFGASAAYTATTPPAGGSAVLLAARDHVGSLKTPLVPARPGDEFLVTLTQKQVSGTLPLVPGVWMYKADGATTTSVLPAYDNAYRTQIGTSQDLGNGWFRSSWKVGIKPGATDCAYVRLWLQINQNPTYTHSVAVTDLVFLKRNGAELIVDGSIIATQIKAGTITANEIESGTITATEIKTGTITANEIATGTITANELSGTAINGMTITGSLIRSAPSGARMEILTGASSSRVNFYSGLAVENGPGYIAMNTSTGEMFFSSPRRSDLPASWNSQFTLSPQRAYITTFRNVSIKNSDSAYSGQIAIGEDAWSSDEPDTNLSIRSSATGKHVALAASGKVMIRAGSAGSPDGIELRDFFETVHMKVNGSGVQMLTPWTGVVENVSSQVGLNTLAWTNNCVVKKFGKTISVEISLTPKQAISANGTSIVLPYGMWPSSSIYFWAVDTNTGGQVAMYITATGELRHVQARAANQGTLGFISFLAS